LYDQIGGLSGGIVGGDALFFSDMVLSTHAGVRQGGFFALRIKKNGSWCYYRDIQQLSNSILDWAGNNCFQLGNANFSANNFQVTIPDAFSQGQMIVLNNTYKIPDPPCGTGTFHDSFFDPVKNKVIYRYINSFPDDYFNWVNVYDQTPNGQTFSVGGYLGVYPQGSDGFNRASLTLPPFVSPNYRTNGAGSLAYQMGTTYYNTISASGFWSIGGSRQKVIIADNDQGEPLNCVTGNSNTFVYQEPLFNYDYSQSFPMKIGAGGNGNIGSCYCENPDIFMCYSDGNNGLFGFQLFSNSFFAMINAANIRPHYGVLFNDGTLIAMQAKTGGVSGAVDIYTAQIDLTSYGITLKPVVENASKCLVNFTRPVSINGSFLT
jgi:hypothetical protein